MVRLAIKIIYISIFLTVIQPLLISSPVLAQAPSIATCKSFLSNYGNSNSVDPYQDNLTNALDWTTCLVNPGGVGAQVFDYPKIIFASNRPDNGDNWEIYIMNIDGNGLTRITTHPARDEEPVFSPDDSKIAFVSDRDGNQEIYTMNPDGTGLKRLTNNSVSDRSPSFSPDGSVIIYTSERSTSNGSTMEIYTMDASTGGNKNRLTTSTIYNSKSRPSSSHQGDLLVFSDDVNLTLLNLNDLTSTPLTTDDNNIDTYASFSPDDSLIVFQSFRQPPPEWPYPKVKNNDIFIINPDGTNETQLTDLESQDIYPAYSVGGEKIVFSSNRADYRYYNLYLMNSDGSDVIQLTNTTAQNHHPSFNHVSANVTLNYVWGECGGTGGASTTFCPSIQGNPWLSPCDTPDQTYWCYYSDCRLDVASPCEYSPSPGQTALWLCKCSLAPIPTPN